MPVEWEYHWSPDVTPESLTVAIRMHTGAKCKVVSVSPDEFVVRTVYRFPHWEVAINPASNILWSKKIRAASPPL